jgi:hypothetical protein
MQEASGLRLGNFVKNDDGTICSIAALHKQADGQIAISSLCEPPGSKFNGYVEELYPIQLTKNILIDSGFDTSK